METIKNILYNNRRLVTILFFFVILFILIYYFTFSNRTNSVVNEFERNFIKNIRKNQLDYCSDNLKKRKISEFYFNSSYLPYLTGFLKYDYNSYDMLIKSIQYGARYIELEVYNKEIKNDTEPIISTGNEMGSVINSLNSLDAKKCFQIIAQFAFSEKTIDNYKDPFFIFFNFRTGNNYRTLDKLSDIITNTIGHKLLNSSYQYEKKNMANVNLCKVMGKVILLSNTKYENSKIKKIINMSTNSTFLRRIRYDQLPLREELAKDDDEPVISFTSSKINLTKNILTIDDETDFIDMGLTKYFIIKINGSKYNDTNQNLLSLKQVTRKNIIFDNSVNFKPESEGKIQIKIFNKSYSLKNLPNDNKTSITIVYPKYDFFYFNYNPQDAWVLGCQFVCLNFQSIDNNLKKNMKKFKKSSILLKPNHLINYIPKKRVPNLNSLYPEYIESDLPIKLDFMDKYQNIYILPVNNENVRLIIDNHTIKLSPNYNLNNSVFEVTEGLNGDFGSISFKYGEQYLISNDNCCYLKFSKTIGEIDSFRQNSSFYPIESLCPNKEYTTFVQKKNGKNYYLKYRQKFNYKTKLYSQKTNDYKFITSISSDDGIVSIWEPINKNLYKSIGHIATVSTDKPTNDAILLKGAIESPIDYKLIWSSEEGISIWKPVPPDGYIALGVVCNNSLNKPLKNKIACVAIEYTEEIEVGQIIWKSEGLDPNKKISFWSSPDLNYFIATDSFNKPSEFINPVYNINTSDKDYMDRLYLGESDSKELEALCFKIFNEADDVVKNERNIINIEQKENYKITSRKIDNLEQKCITVNNSLWSKYYLDENFESEGEKLKLDVCNNQENEFGSDWSIYSNDKTIRLKGNPKFCLTVNNDELFLTKCNNSDNQKFNVKDNSNDTDIKYYDTVSKNIKCLENVDDELMFMNCQNKTEQRWSVIQHKQTTCITKNKIIFIKEKIRRGKNKYLNNKSDNTGENNILNEFVDMDYLHLYIKGIVEEDLEDKWKIKLYNNLGYKYIDKNKGNLILNSIPYKNTLQKGAKVLCKNGGIIGNKYNESNTRWPATIVKVLPNENFSIVFNINTIESNMNRQSLGRPRTSKIKLVKLEDLILLKSSLKC